MSTEIDKPVLKARAALGMASRHGRKASNPEGEREARATLAAAKLERYIKQTIAEAPPISDETLDKLALLLRPAPAAAKQPVRRVRGVVRNTSGGE